jgi:hypothetical protein
MSRVKVLRAYYIALDESILAALRKELDICGVGYGAAPETDPEAMFIAWSLLHFRSLISDMTDDLPESMLALSLAEAMLRVRDDAIEIIRPHCEDLQ